ncbi:hypothetical protein [Ornithobacterium rhinotracheale]
MKLRFIMLSLCVLGNIAVINAQQDGRVGVNTQTPTETLQVDGTVRVVELPNNGDENAIRTTPQGNDAGSKSQTFNAIKTLVVDKNGVVGTVEGVPNSGKDKEMHEIVEENGTILYNPIRRCWKGSVGDGVVERSMSFPQIGYKFLWKESGAGKFAVYAKRVGDYVNEETKHGTVRQNIYPVPGVLNGLLGGSEGDVDIQGENEVGLFNASYHVSTAGQASLVIGETGQTFNFTWAAKNYRGNKIMNLCIEQTVL